MTECPRDLTRATPRSRPLVILALLALLASLFVIAAPVAAQNSEGVTVTPNDQLNGCNGVRETPGSENTIKSVFGGTLEPGGTAVFMLEYPVEGDNESEEDVAIDDCLFLDDTAVARWDITAPNDPAGGFITFEVTLPDDPEAIEYCNHAKVTGPPSASPGSNRKGSVCFRLAGNLLVTKTDGAGAPLAGAVFDVACTLPESEAFLTDVVIGAPNTGDVGGAGASAGFPSTSGGSVSAEVTTGDRGEITVHAPLATACTFTETAAPAGYNPATPATTTLTVNQELGTYNFVNQVIPTPSPSAAPSATAAPTATPAGGPGAASVRPTEAPNTAVPGAGLMGGTGLLFAGLLVVGSVAGLGLLSRWSAARRLG